MEKKPFKQEISSLKTKVIDEIRNIIGGNHLFTENKPTFTIDGDTIETILILNVDGDLYVYGKNLDMENDDVDMDVKLHISEFEVSFIIEMYESIE